METKLQMMAGVNAKLICFTNFYAQNLSPVDTERKLNIHKTFRRRAERLGNVLCTFSLRPVSTGDVSAMQKPQVKASEAAIHRFSCEEVF